MPNWKKALFTEKEFRVLCPDVPYFKPGQQVSEGVVVREFHELGLGRAPKIFSFDGQQAQQKIPVRITLADGSVENTVWFATITEQGDAET